VTLSTTANLCGRFVFFRGQCEQQSWQILATIDQSDIRGTFDHSVTTFILTCINNSNSRRKKGWPSDFQKTPLKGLGSR
jgi:hypothetical protein